MCTAITYHAADHYFGRNLDLEHSYGESVAIMPRSYPLALRCGEILSRHHAIIGMAHMADGYPLYYEATNEHGLSAAGLNFPESAVYHAHCPNCRNIAPFELIAWLLGSCATLAQARHALERTNLWQQDFSSRLPATPLHWLVADSTGAIVVESTFDGLHLHENDVGVLTNEPPFPFHRANLALYHALTPDEPAEPAFSRGMGTYGLPGGLDSVSRFVRAAFTRANSLSGEDESSAVSQFFHLLSAVEQQRGCVHLPQGQYELTRYSSCCNTTRGIYYYTTYDNRAITAVSLHREELDGDTVAAYPLLTEQRVEWQN